MAASAWYGDPHDVVERLLGRQRGAAADAADAEHAGPVGRGAEAIAHDARPQPPARPVLRHLLEEVGVGVEEEAELAAHLVDGEPAGAAALDVRDRVREREGELLHRRRARIAEVGAGDRDRVEARSALETELDRVDDESQRRLGREDPGAPGDVLLEDVVLDRAADLVGGHALLLGHGDVHGEQDRGGAVDRERRRHLAERYAVEDRLHVGERVDRDADPPDLLLDVGVVRVVADLRRQVERHREAGGALSE